jgi:nitric oxide dioxygenase
MTPEQVAVVQDTLLAVTPRAGELSDRFYERLFEADPALRSLFPADLTEQRRKFSAELTELVALVSDLDGLLPRARALGARHRAYGVRATHYQPTGERVIASLAELLGPEWTDDAERAWRAAYRLVSEAMIQGSHEGAVGG